MPQIKEKWVEGERIFLQFSVSKYVQLFTHVNDDLYSIKANAKGKRRNYADVENLPNTFSLETNLKKFEH